MIRVPNTIANRGCFVRLIPIIEIFIVVIVVILIVAVVVVVVVVAGSVFEQHGLRLSMGKGIIYRKT